jgi:2-phospho-L-lactate guanylyltransferase
VAQALVPLKDLVEAKSRLAGLLRPSERRALAQAMAEDVLTVLQRHERISRITLVSDDPGAGLLAEKYGAQCWSEKSLKCRGLNALIQCASARLLDDGEEPLIVLHADLPLLAARDIDTVLDSHRETAGLVIGCDRNGRGTNLLAFDAASVPDFCFGTDSCARHLASAHNAGIAAQVLHIAGIELDVDEASDLKFVTEQLSSNRDSHTASLLHKTELGVRVGSALASMMADPVDDTKRGVAS